jgi:hypothetical protein
MHIDSNIHLQFSRTNQSLKPKVKRSPQLTAPRFETTRVWCAIIMHEYLIVTGKHCGTSMNQTNQDTLQNKEHSSCASLWAPLFLNGGNSRCTRVQTLYPDAPTINITVGVCKLDRGCTSPATPWLSISSCQRVWFVYSNRRDGEAKNWKFHWTHCPL